MLHRMLDTLVAQVQVIISVDYAISQHHEHALHTRNTIHHFRNSN